MTQKNLFSDQDKIIIIIIIIIIWTLIPLPRYSIFILKVTFENTPGRFCCNCSIMSSSWCLQWIERIYDMIIMPPFLCTLPSELPNLSVSKDNMNFWNWRFSSAYCEEPTKIKSNFQRNLVQKELWWSILVYSPSVNQNIKHVFWYALQARLCQ